VLKINSENRSVWAFKLKSSFEEQEIALPWLLFSGVKLNSEKIFLFCIVLMLMATLNFFKPQHNDRWKIYLAGRILEIDHSKITAEAQRICFLRYLYPYLLRLESIRIKNLIIKLLSLIILLWISLQLGGIGRTRQISIPKSQAKNSKWDYSRFISCSKNSHPPSILNPPTKITKIIKQLKSYKKLTLQRRINLCKMLCYHLRILINLIKLKSLSYLPEE